MKSKQTVHKNNQESKQKTANNKTQSEKQINSKIKQENNT